MASPFRRPTGAPTLSLRQTRAGVLVHDKVIQDGVIPALHAAEARVLRLEALLARPLLGRLRWLLTGR